MADAGKGLFAMDKSQPANAVIFKKGQIICDYLGERLTETEVTDRYGEDHTAPYAIELKKDVIIDASKERSYCSLCNQALHKRSANSSLVPNWQAKPQKVSLKATKNILNGEEILTWYGGEYDFDEKFTTIYEKKKA